MSSQPNTTNSTSNPPAPAGSSSTDTSITIRRLSSIVEAHRLWDFLRDGILYEARYFRYSHSLDVYRKILWNLVARKANTAWVGVAFHADTPVGFVLAHDVTPLFAEIREFEVSMFYFRPGWKCAVRALQRGFDKFCTSENVSRYYLSTSSFCSSAERVFHDSWRGLERSNTVFKRDLKKTQ